MSSYYCVLFIINNYNSHFIFSAEQQRQQDIEYIKENLGKALRITLASVIVQQPKNPLNYLANALLHYRYTQLLNQKKEIELEKLLNERNEIQEEMLKKVNI